MSKDKIVLIGMMGAGKTTLGRLFALETGRRFFDVDAIVEAGAGLTVAEIFRRDGEDGFRRLELETLQGIVSRPGAAVVAAGGGAFCQEPVREALKDCRTVFLRVTEEELLRRLALAGVGERPLLASPDWRERVLELVRSRYPVYERASHVLDIGDEPPERTSARLAGLFGRERAEGVGHADHIR